MGKGNDIMPAFKSVYREVLRALRGGFTITEYDRARSEYLSRLEKAYNNRDKVENEKYAKEIVRYFIDNVPMPGIETEYNMMNMVANQIPVEAINQTLKQYIIKPSLNPWDEAYLITMDDPFDVLLDLVCENFID